MATYRCLSMVAMLAMALVFSTSRQAWAQQPKRHDGFYLRLSSGLTYLADPAEATWPGVKVDGSLTGSGFAWDAAVGGSPVPGLALGGGVFMAHVASPAADDMQATIGGVVELDGDVEFDAMTFALIAPFIDYYPAPSEGFHLTAAVGLGLLSLGDGTLDGSSYVPFEDHGSHGLGALVGLGYEFWIADQWSLGVLARVTYAAPSGDDGETEWRHHLWLPALLGTATWH